MTSKSWHLDGRQQTKRRAKGSAVALRTSNWTVAFFTSNAPLQVPYLPLPLHGVRRLVHFYFLYLAIYSMRVFITMAVRAAVRRGQTVVLGLLLPHLRRALFYPASTVPGSCAWQRGRCTFFRRRAVNIAGRRGSRTRSERCAFHAGCALERAFFVIRPMTPCSETFSYGTAAGRTLQLCWLTLDAVSSGAFLLGLLLPSLRTHSDGRADVSFSRTTIPRAGRAAQANARTSCTAAANAALQFPPAIPLGAVSPALTSPTPILPGAGATARYLPTTYHTAAGYCNAFPSCADRCDGCRSAGFVDASESVFQASAWKS